MRDDPLQIIVTTTEKATPQVVEFEQLYPIKDKITSIIFLWNTNSYYVNIEDNTFMINGGRKLVFATFGEAHVLYRKRSAVSFAVGSPETSEKTITWIIGLENEEGEKLFLKLQDNGKTWQWANEL